MKEEGRGREGGRGPASKEGGMGREEKGKVGKDEGK